MSTSQYISKINVAGTEYSVKDTEARDNLNTLSNTTAKKVQKFTYESSIGVARDYDSTGLEISRPVLFGEKSKDHNTYLLGVFGDIPWSESALEAGLDQVGRNGGMSVAQAIVEASYATIEVIYPNCEDSGHTTAHTHSCIAKDFITVKWSESDPIEYDTDYKPVGVKNPCCNEFSCTTAEDGSGNLVTTHVSNTPEVGCILYYNDNPTAPGYYYGPTTYWLQLSSNIASLVESYGDEYGSAYAPVSVRICCYN